jgi:hypothetical protein
MHHRDRRQPTARSVPISLVRSKTEIIWCSASDHADEQRVADATTPCLDDAQPRLLWMWSRTGEAL